MVHFIATNCRAVFRSSEIEHESHNFFDLVIYPLIFIALVPTFPCY